MTSLEQFIVISSETPVVSAMGTAEGHGTAHQGQEVDHTAVAVQARPGGTWCERLFLLRQWVFLLRSSGALGGTGMLPFLIIRGLLPGLPMADFL